MNKKYYSILDIIEEDGTLNFSIKNKIFKGKRESQVLKILREKEPKIQKISIQSYYEFEDELLVQFSVKCENDDIKHILESMQQINDKGLISNEEH